LESELVGGFFTEHSSVPFVFFFLAEYSSIVLFSCLTAILFLGGYNLPHILTYFLSLNDLYVNLPSFVLGVKTCLFCFFFVWFRATLPRLRYDQLMEVCWLYVLPVAVGFILLAPCLMFSLGFFL
jgi:NADH-ubiquinone oxidoreductase chain 1